MAEELRRYVAAGLPKRRLSALIGLALLLCAHNLPAPSFQSHLLAQAPAPGFVRLNLEGETRLPTLIRYVTDRLNIRILYSPDLVDDRTVNVRAPKEIPVSSLLPLLSSVLKMENLVLVDADVPGFKRIVDIRELPRVSRPGNAQQVLDEQGAAAPVTQAFMLKYISASQVQTLIRPLMTQGQGAGAGPNILAIGDTNVLVVTDYAPTVVTIGKLIELIDRPRGQIEFEFYQVEHLDAPGLAEQIQRMLGGPATPRQRPAGQGTASGQATLSSVELIPNQRTNQIVIVGSKLLIEEARALLRRFDVSLGLSTEVYRFEYVQSERFDKLVKGFLGAEDSGRLYRSTVDEKGNLLIVRATAEVHERIRELSDQIDVPVEAEDSPIRFYKLKNANAADVLYTLRSLQELTGASLFGGGGFSPFGSFPGNTLYPGSGFGGLQSGLPGMELPGTLNQVPSAQPSIRDTRSGTNQPLRLPLDPSAGAMGAYEQTQQTRADRLSGVTGLGGLTGFGGGQGFAAAATLPGGARVSADLGTNSLVVYAPPDVQQMYAKLIESLDRRRRQVLIEAEIVAVDTSHSFRLGVEYSTGDRTGVERLFEFTSFGLSEVDPITGALAISPALGFNGTLVNADVADVVVQALATHRGAQVLAAPRILVNDNQRGSLQSTVNIPYASVNASQTVSTTSFGGEQNAGTIITVIPHINQDDHLLLDFSVEFSTFTGESADATLPPTRQEDTIESSVTIPDGHTVIVGGLKRISNSRSTTGIPYLEKIPILRELSSLNTSQQSTVSFFLFIRPIILRDDRFADLRFVSDKSLHDAERPGQYPSSTPIMIE
jgi:general secretion pathway protein D